MFLAVDLSHPQTGGLSPSQKHNPMSSNSGNQINDFLCERLPPLVGVAMSLVSTNCETGVEHENTSLSPRCKQTTIVWWWSKVRVVFLEPFINVDQ